MQWGKARDHLRARAAHLETELSKLPVSNETRDVGLAIFYQKMFYTDLADAIDAGLPRVKFVKNEEAPAEIPVEAPVTVTGLGSNTGGATLSNLGFANAEPTFAFNNDYVDIQPNRGNPANPADPLGIEGPGFSYGR